MRSCFFPVVLLLACHLGAQSPAKSDLAPCGAPPGLDPWLLEYFKHPIKSPPCAPTCSAKKQRGSPAKTRLRPSRMLSLWLPL